MRLLLLLMLTLLITPVVSAAVIQGKIYDLELNRLDNVVVEIDTIPRQRVISQNGEYFFNAPKGDYTINARALIEGIIHLTSENISIIDEGEYIIDLFLFPELEDIPDVSTNALDNNENKKSIIPYLAILVLVAIIFLLLRISRKKKIPPEADEDADKIYNVIKKEKRITQKEIRKRSALSEAKISLIIAQLEKEGKIQKIKKGGANIIILR